MKRFSMVVAVALVFLMSTPLMAQQRPDGFGIGLGQGTLSSGLSGKLHSGNLAFQGVVGCWGYSCRGAGLSFDVLVNMPIFVDADVVQLGWNIGGGPSVGIGDGPRYYWDGRRRGYFTLHGQFVAGLELIFPSIPIDLVFEWRPHLEIVPRPRPHFVDFGAHVRIYL